MSTQGTGDPFKSPTSSNVSSDPFGGDPFGVKGTATSDPFKTPPAGAFSGGDPFQSTGQLSSDPFKPSPKDPFSSNPFGADFFQSKPAVSNSVHMYVRMYICSTYMYGEFAVVHCGTI